MDRGKSDSSSRSIAIGQTLCLVVQIIIRQRRHLEVSQLEIGTAAFVSCAITIYALNWHKPKDIGVEWPATPVTRQYVEAINYRF